MGFPGLYRSADSYQNMRDSDRKKGGFIPFEQMVFALRQRPSHNIQEESKGILFLCA
jgi:hypothetical protein